jgi:hypothetical protein
LNRFGEVFGSDGVCAVKIGNCSSDTCDAIECSKGRPPSLLLCDDVSKAVVILASALPAAAMSLTMANQQMAIHRAMQARSAHRKAFYSKTRLSTTSRKS